MQVSRVLMTQSRMRHPAYPGNWPLAGKIDHPEISRLVILPIRTPHIVAPVANTFRFNIPEPEEQLRSVNSFHLLPTPSIPLESGSEDKKHRRSISASSLLEVLHAHTPVFLFTSRQIGVSSQYRF